MTEITVEYFEDTTTISCTRNQFPTFQPVTFVSPKQPSAKHSHSSHFPPLSYVSTLKGRVNPSFFQVDLIGNHHEIFALHPFLTSEPSLRPRMVEFEEIKDDDYSDIGAVVDDQDEWSDQSATDDDDDDDEEDIANETIFDRIVALKDLIPADRRDVIACTLLKAYSYGRLATYIGGRAVHLVVTAALMIGIPYSVAVQSDKEWFEKMQIEQTMNQMNQVCSPTSTFFCGFD
jgi:mitochondrial import receptor subunit TOM22